jgi:hypothetical protein
MGPDEWSLDFIKRHGRKKICDIPLS